MGNSGMILKLEYATFFLWNKMLLVLEIIHMKFLRHIDDLNNNSYLHYSCI